MKNLKMIKRKSKKKEKNLKKWSNKSLMLSLNLSPSLLVNPGNHL